MKLYQKIASLLVVAALAVVMMPVCMAAPGDSITTRVLNAVNARSGSELYEEFTSTEPDGTTQSMTMARSGGNAYIKMPVGDAGDIVYILKDGEGYLLDAETKLAIKSTVPKVTVTESEDDSSEEVQGVENRLNVNGQDYDALSYTFTRDDGQTVTISYCVDGETLKYTVTDAPEGRSITEFKVITTTVDQNLFNIPADYQVMTEEEWNAAHPAQ